MPDSTVTVDKEKLAAQIQDIILELEGLRRQLLGPVVLSDVSEPYSTQQSEGSLLPYHTICLSASSLDWWLNLTPSGYEGDALLDTEAIYDQV